MEGAKYLTKPVKGTILHHEPGAMLPSRHQTLEYGCFTMLCEFQVYSKGNQLHICTYPLFFRLFSHIGHYRALSRVPCAIQQVLICYLFYT